ncbi:MAG: hypothetical protein AAF086_01605 [Planctomycetota bacterium]
MSEEISTGHQVASTVLNVLDGIGYFLVVSSIDLELLRNNSGVKSKQLKQLLTQIPEVSEFCQAFDSGGIKAVKSLALSANTIPQSAWLLSKQSEFGEVLDGIYYRLKLSTYPHDAYEYGLHGEFAWISLWLD